MDFIYSRQSVDKADSISIESQIEYCRYETRGGPCRIFSDKGYSGKNTDRPAFRRMMEALRQGGASRVIVYKLDRISRSILDFAGMIEEFQRGCLCRPHEARLFHGRACAVWLCFGGRRA